ncbi:MAG: polysaccharide pyruvyl transferase CsaB [Armatimonadota bacterium]|nr:polysaccharide pyruvyl transferase CsaB [bacterium]
MRKRIVLSGYYGFGNTGDEAVLAGILATFEQIGLDAEVTVLSADPARTMAQHPGVKAVHRYKPAQLLCAIAGADLFISGGGSLLQDATSARSAQYYLFIIRLARLLRRKTMIYAQGIGPINRDSIRKSVASVINGMDIITVRDPDSKTLLEDIGVHKPVEVVADPAFLVKPDLDAADRVLVDYGVKGKDIITVCLRSWGEDSEWLPAAAEGIRAACEEIGAVPVMVPMQEPDDVAVSQSVTGGVVLRGLDDVRVVKGVIARSRLVVGMRLHSLIFAASEATPFVPLVYDPKVASFASIAGEDGLRVPDLHSLSAESVKSAIAQIWARRDDIANRIKEKAPALIEAATIPAKQAAHLLGFQDT